MHRWAWALGAAILASCGTYGAPDSVVFGQAVLTQPSPGFNFKPLTTYYLDPIANVVGDDPKNPTPVDMRNAPYTGILSTIDGRMQAYGYTPAPTSGTPVPPAQGTANTVGLKVSVLKGTAATYYPGYWCDYWYYYSCYYNWYYAGSYNYGMLILQIGDLSTPAPPVGQPGQPLKVLWLTGIYGVAQGVTWDVPNVVNSLNRAFDQSPYLDTH
jgi:hypothetical protein